MTEKWTV